MAASFKDISQNELLPSTIQLYHTIMQLQQAFALLTEVGQASFHKLTMPLYRQPENAVVEDA